MRSFPFVVVQAYPRDFGNESIFLHGSVADVDAVVSASDWRSSRVISEHRSEATAEKAATKAYKRAKASAEREECRSYHSIRDASLILSYKEAAHG